MVLRSVLRAKPPLRRCLTRCRHCGIFFLTHPRNAGRDDLRCPFGCRAAHRRRESIRRSTEYYGDEEGRKYKRRQNQRQREKRQARAAAPGHPPGESLSTPAPPEPLPTARTSGASRLPPAPPTPLIAYVRMVVSLVEGRPVSRAELLEMLQRVLRQHTMSRRRRLDHTLGWWHEHPP